MRIASLLLIALALCGCHKSAERPPAPWTNYRLSYELRAPSSGAGSSMEVYKGSVGSDHMGGNTGYFVDQVYRVLDISPGGVHVEAGIQGAWSADETPVPFHVTQTFFVPYTSKATLPITKDLTLEMHFTQN